MSNSKVILNQEHAGISILTLNYPEKRNALSIAMMEELCHHLEDIQRDTSQRVLILQGADPVFCTGLDLSETFDAKLMNHSSSLIARLLVLLYHFPIVTIAAVKGAVYAGGAGLMSVCDLSLAEEGTIFAFPEVRRGLIPSLVLTFLRRQIREKDLSELLLFGESIDAARAVQIGLINRIVPSGRLFQEAIKMANFALEGAPRASCDTKHLIKKLSHPSIEEDLKVAQSYHLQARSSEEAKEGARAFLDKRKPCWVK